MWFELVVGIVFFVLSIWMALLSMATGDRIKIVDPELPKKLRTLTKHERRAFWKSKSYEIYHDQKLNELVKRFHFSMRVFAISICLIIILGFFRFVFL